MNNQELPYRKGVGIVLFNALSQVWIGKRIVKPGQEIENYWQMPQGGIDDGEYPEQAVFRELEEETGSRSAEIIRASENWFTYDLPENLRGHVWGGKFRGQKQKWFALKYTGNEQDFNLNQHREPEFSEWLWTDFINLPQLIVPFKIDLYQKIINEFSDLSVRADR